jgi:hypothetical protein
MSSVVELVPSECETTAALSYQGDGWRNQSSAGAGQTARRCDLAEIGVDRSRTAFVERGR